MHRLTSLKVRLHMASYLQLLLCILSKFPMNRFAWELWSYHLRQDILYQDTGEVEQVRTAFMVNLFIYEGQNEDFWNLDSVHNRSFILHFCTCSLFLTRRYIFPLCAKCMHRHVDSLGPSREYSTMVEKDGLACFYHYFSI